MTVLFIEILKNSYIICSWLNMLYPLKKIIIIIIITERETILFFIFYFVNLINNNWLFRFEKLLLYLYIIYVTPWVVIFFINLISLLPTNLNLIKLNQIELN